MPIVWKRALGMAGVVYACVGVGQASAIGTSGAAQHPNQSQLVCDALGLRTFRAVEAMIEPDPAISRRVVVAIDLGDGPTRLVLDQYSVRATEFTVSIQGDLGAPNVTTPPPPSTYRGFVPGTGEEVAASIIDGRLSAAVRPTIGEPTFIQPLSEVVNGAPATSCIVYTASDIRDLGWRCGTDALVCPDCPPEVGAAGGLPPPVCLRSVEVLFDTDHPFYQQRGSSAATVVSDIENIANQVDLIYRRDLAIGVVVRQINVRTTPSDAYSDIAIANVDPTTLLNRIGTIWSGVSAPARDLVHLMTGRALSSSTIGVAWVGVVCRSSTNNTGLSQSLFTSNLGMRTILTAHEMGHNFGASHDSGGSFIMAPSTGSGSQQQFSAGSISVINAFVGSNGGCLTTAGPTIVADVVQAQAGQPLLIDVLANDIVGCSGAWVLSLPTTSTSSGGSLSLSIASGPGGRDQIRYVPPASVPPSGLSDSFTYRAMDASGQAGIGIVTASIAPTGGCLADFNSSGDVSVQDVFDFLTAYFEHQPSADVNESGSVTVQDVFDYLVTYFQGC